jgi:hypothetical protein
MYVCMYVCMNVCMYVCVKVDKMEILTVLVNTANGLYFVKIYPYIFAHTKTLSFHERSERAKRANVVSGMVENLRRKKFLPARIGVGGCRLSVCPSVRPSVYATLLNNF